MNDKKVRLNLTSIIKSSLLCISDLKQELKVMERVPKEKKLDDSTNESSIFNGLSPNPSRTQVEIETQTSLMSPQKRKYQLLIYIEYCADWVLMF